MNCTKSCREEVQHAKFMLYTNFEQFMRMRTELLIAPPTALFTTLHVSSALSEQCEDTRLLLFLGSINTMSKLLCGRIDRTHCYIQAPEYFAFCGKDR